MVKCQSTLYFDKELGDTRHRISLPASEDDLKVLAETCQPTTFGLGLDDTLDLDYRDAWKIDNTHFPCSLHPSDEISGFSYRIL